MSDQCCAFGGRGLMAATVATVAYLGLEARAVEVQVQLSVGLAARSPSSACPTRRSPRAASASARRLPRSGSRFRPRHHRQPVARRPAQGRLALRSSDRACACSRRSARPTPRRCRTMSRSASSCLDGRIAASPGVLLAALHASAQRQGPDLPGRAGQRSELGGRARRHRRARPAGAARASQGHRAASRRRRRPKPSRPTAVPTSPRSRGRKSPSARSRSPRPAGTIC